MCEKETKDKRVRNDRRYNSDNIIHLMIAHDGNKTDVSQGSRY